MYIQITERCNMSCAHCGMAATRRGRDMEWETFKAAVDADQGSISLGGGEPTIHPLFEKFLFYAIGKCESVWLATNGSITNTALVLASLAQKGVLGVALSLDQWHDPIDPSVIEAFTRNTTRDMGHGIDIGREIRDTSSNIVKAGRAARQSFVDDHGIETTAGCICEDIFVKPDGSVHQCGCRKSPKIGDAFTGWKLMASEDGDECCYKKCERSKKVA